MISQNAALPAAAKNPVQRGRGRAADCGPDQTADEPPGEQQQHHGHHCRDVLLQP
jgi:hypothetical protein